MVPGVEVEKVLGAPVSGVAIPWSEAERGVLTTTNTQIKSTAIKLVSCPEALCVESLGMRQGINILWGCFDGFLLGVPPPSISVRSCPTGVFSRLSRLTLSTFLSAALSVSRPCKSPPSGDPVRGEEGGGDGKVYLTCKKGEG